MAAVRDVPSLQRVRLLIDLGGATSQTVSIRNVSSLSADSISQQIKEAFRTLNLQHENVQFYDPACMEDEEITDVITLSGLAGLLADVMLRQQEADDAGLRPAWNGDHSVMTIELRAKVPTSRARPPSEGAGGEGAEEQGEEEHDEAALGTEANADVKERKQKKEVLVS